MGFFDSLFEGVASVVGAAAPAVSGAAASGALGPTAAAAAAVAGGPGGGAPGVAGVAGAVGAAEEVAAQVRARANQGVGGGGGAGAFVRTAGALNNTLGSLLATNGIHPAPNANIKATVVLLLTPNGAAFVDSVDRGTPAVMSRDMQITKKTIKRVAKMAKRIPRKTVPQSMNAQINESVKRKIMDDLSCSPALRRLTSGGDSCG